MTTATIEYGQVNRRGFSEYIAVASEQTRVIFKCKNKACKNVWAREYRKCFMSMGNHGYREGRFYNNPDVYVLNRIDESGREIRIEYDYGCCPACGGEAVTSDEVKGVHTDKKCDARCVSATKGVCECSCGGANHGAGHLM